MTQARLPRSSSIRRNLLVHTAIGVVLALVEVSGAQAGPVGASSPNGVAAPPTVAVEGATTNVTLNQSRTLIDWTSFNVTSSETVNFRFGSNGDIVLNRVNGLINVDGRLNGWVGGTVGGNVWLLGSRGVIFGPNAQVNVGGLMATTTPLFSDQEFLSGGNSLTFRDGRSDAGILVNSGARLVSAGALALIAPSVTTEAGAQILADGTVTYGAAENFRIKFDESVGGGFDLLEFEVPTSALEDGTISATPLTLNGVTTAGNVIIAAISRPSLVNALVSIGGMITAQSASRGEGGEIILSATGGPATVNVTGALAADRSVTMTAAGGDINVSGSVTARSDTGQGGSIAIGDGATAGVRIRAGGTLDASSTGARLEGGDVVVTATGVRTDGLIDVSGPAGGGSIRFGGGFQGNDSAVANADYALIGSNAVLNADATQNGDGGNVVVWSEQATTFRGQILARGGVSGGDGGQAEVSSHGYLDFAGGADLRATHGASGTLLLDPQDITIVETGTAPPDLDDDNGFTAPGSGNGTTEIGADQITDQLRDSNVAIVTNSGTITFEAGSTIEFDDNTVRSLSFTAANGFVFNETDLIDVTGPDALNFTLTSGAGLSLGSTNISTEGGNITLTAQNGALALGTGNLLSGGGNVVLSATGTPAATGTITTSTGAITTGGGDLTMTATGAITTGAGAINAGIGDITMTAGGILTLGAGSIASSGAGTQDVELTGTSVHIDGTINTDILDITATSGNITQSATSVITDTTVRASAPGQTVDLTGLNTLNASDFDNITGAIVKLKVDQSTTITDIGALLGTPATTSLEFTSTNNLTVNNGNPDPFTAAAISLTATNALSVHDVTATTGNLVLSGASIAFDEALVATLGSVSLTTTNAANTLNIAQNVTAGTTITLTSAKDITQTATMLLSGTSLTATASAGSITLTEANTLAGLGAVSATGSDATPAGVAITSASAMTITGAVQTLGANNPGVITLTGAPLTLATTGSVTGHVIQLASTGAMTISGDITATVADTDPGAGVTLSPGSVTLTSTVSIGQGAGIGSVIDTPALTATANAGAGTISLLGANKVTQLAGRTNFILNGSAITFHNDLDTVVDDLATSLPGTNTSLNFAAVGTNHSLTIIPQLTSGAITLAATGLLTTAGVEGAGAVSLTGVGVTSSGLIEATGDNNTITVAGGTGGVTLTGGATAAGNISITGTTASTAGALSTTGTNDSITANISGGSLGLSTVTATGAISLTGVGVTASGLVSTTGSEAALTVAAGTGGFTLTGGAAAEGNISLTGTTDSTSGAALTTTGTDNSITANVSGGTLGLASVSAAGTIGLTGVNGVTATGDIIATGAAHNVTVSASNGAIALGANDVTATGLISLTGQTITVDDLSAGTGITAAASTGILSVGDATSPLGNISLTAADTLTVAGPVTATAGDVTISAPGEIVDLTGVVVTAGRDLTLSGDSFTIDGLTSLSVVRDYSLTIASQPTGILYQPTFIPGRNYSLTVTAGDFLAPGALTATGSLSITATTGTVTTGLITAEGITLNGTTVTLNDDVNAGASLFSVTATTGGITRAGIVDITADSIFASAQDTIQLGALTALNGITLIGADVIVDGALSAAAGTVSLTAIAGTVSQSAAITAVTLQGGAVDGFVLNNASNAINVLGPINNTTSGGIDIVSTNALAVTGHVQAAGQTIEIASGGAISDTGAGGFTADTLVVSGSGGIILNGANNAVSNLEATNTGAGGLTFVNTTALNVDLANSGAGALLLTTTTGNLTIDGAVTATGQPATLNATAGQVLQTSGAIIADTLAGTALNGYSLTSATNSVGSLSNLHATAPTADIVYNSSPLFGPILVLTNVTAGRDILVTQGGIFGGISLTGVVNAGRNLSLTSGSIAQSGAGVVTAGTVSGSATNGNFNLSTLNNVITNLGAISATGDVAVRSVNASLTLTGNITTGALGRFDLVNANAAGTISQSGGIITTSIINATSPGALSLNGANVVGTVESLVTTLGSGNITFNAARDAGLTVTTATAGGTLSLTNTGSGDNTGNLVLGDLTTPSTLTVTSTMGSVTQSAGDINAGTLAGGAFGGFLLGQGLGQNVHVATLGNITASTDVDATGTLGVRIVDLDNLTIAGDVDGGRGPVNLTAPKITQSAGASINGQSVNLSSSGGTLMSLAGDVTAVGAVTISGGGAFTLTGTGSIDAGSVVTTSVGKTTVAGDINAGAEPRVLGNTVSITGAGIDQTGGEISGFAVTLTSTGNGNKIELAGNVTARTDATTRTADNKVTLNSAGGIDQTAGLVYAGTLETSSQGVFDLDFLDVLFTSLAFHDDAVINFDNDVSILSLTNDGGSTTITGDGDLEFTGELSSLENLTLDAVGALTGLAATSTTGSVTLEGATVTFTGALTGPTGVSVTSTANSPTPTIQLATIVSSGPVDLDGRGITVTGAITGTTVTAAAGAAALSVQGVTGTGAVSLSGTGVTASGLLTGTSVTVNAGSALASLASATSTSGALSVTGTGVTATGTLTGANGLAVHGGSGAVSLQTVNTTAGLTDIDGAAITLNQPVTGGGAVDIDGTGLVTAGAVSATGALTIDGVGIAASGLLSGSSVTLNAGSALASLVNATSTSGALSVTGTGVTATGALTGANGLAVHGGTGAVSLQGVTATAGLTDIDGAAITLNQPVTGGGAVDIDGTGLVTTGAISAGGALTIDGVGVASSALLSGTSVTVNAGAALASLAAATSTVGALSVTGAGVTATGTLTGANGLAVHGGAGAVNLQDVITTAGLTDIDGAAITLNQPLTGGGAVDIDGTGLVTTGAVSANGALTVDGAGVTSTGTLSGTSGVTVTSTGAGNRISIAGVTGGPVTLTSNGAVGGSSINAGALSGSTLNVTGSSGLVSLGSAAGTGAVSITGLGVSASGNLGAGTTLTVDGTTGSVSLATTSSGGLTTITGSGVAATGTLNGGAGGVTVTSNGAGNRINIANVTGGPINLTSNGQVLGSSLSAGALNGSTINVTGDSGLVSLGSATGSGAVVISGAGVTSGAISGLPVTVNGNAGNLSLSTVSSTGNVNLTGSNVSTGLVTVGGTYDLTGATFAGSALAPVFSSVTGDFNLTDTAGGLTFTSLNAADLLTITVQDGGALVGGTTSSGGATTATAGSISLAGAATTNGDIALTASTGGLSLSGPVTAGGVHSVLLTSTLGSVSGAGAITASVLNAQAATGINLSGANQVASAVLNNSGAGGVTFLNSTFTNPFALTALSTGAGAVDVRTGGNFILPANLTATHLPGAATFVAGGTGTLSGSTSLTSVGTASLQSGGSMTLGTVTSNTGSIVLTSGGAIDTGILTALAGDINATSSLTAGKLALDGFSAQNVTLTGFDVEVGQPIGSPPGGSTVNVTGVLNLSATHDATINVANTVLNVGNFFGGNQAILRNTGATTVSDARGGTLIDVRTGGAATVTLATLTGTNGQVLVESTGGAATLRGAALGSGGTVSVIASGAATLGADRGAAPAASNILTGGAATPILLVQGGTDATINLAGAVNATTVTAGAGRADVSGTAVTLGTLTANGGTGDAFATATTGNLSITTLTAGRLGTVSAPLGQVTIGTATTAGALTVGGRGVTITTANAGSSALAVTANTNDAQVTNATAGTINVTATLGAAFLRNVTIQGSVPGAEVTLKGGGNATLGHIAGEAPGTAGGTLANGAALVTVDAGLAAVVDVTGAANLKAVIARGGNATLSSTGALTVTGVEGVSAIGAISITSPGAITLTKAATTGGAASIVSTGGAITVSDRVTATSGITLTTPQAINAAILDAGGALQLSGSSVTTTGLTKGSSIVATATTAVALGQITSVGLLTATGQSVAVGATGQTSTVGGVTTLTSSAGGVTVNGTFGVASLVASATGGGINIAGATSATGAASLVTTGNLTINSLSGDTVLLRGADLDLTTLLEARKSCTTACTAPTLAIETIRGNLNIGDTGAGSGAEISPQALSNAMTINAAEIGRIKGAEVTIYAGNTTNAAQRGDVEIGDAALDISRINTLTILAGGDNSVAVIGAVVPGAGGGSNLVIGSADALAGWTPEDLTISSGGSLGAGIGHGTPEQQQPLKSLAINVLDNIVIGNDLFVTAINTAIDGNLLDTINITRNQPLGVQRTNLEELNQNFITADTLTLRANGVIVSQNTGRTGDPQGILLTNRDQLDTVLTLGRVGDPPASGFMPELIDLSLSFVNPAGTLITKQNAASSAGIDLTNLVRTEKYRINGCVIGAGGTCTPPPNTVVDVGIGRLVQGVELTSQDPPPTYDPTITGAGNEEIWRSREDCNVEEGETCP